MRYNSISHINLKKEGEHMSKPIQATPCLSGKDASELRAQVATKPTYKAIQKNNMLKNVLENIQKQNPTLDS